MPGGLLNLVSSGNQNILLNGNPQKTFWKSTHKRYTNFGLQNFRLDYEGVRQLSMMTPTMYTYKVKRYAELLTDMYLVVQFPDIYSPIAPPVSCDPTDPNVQWVPYEFKWIRNLGAMMIQSIRFTIGGNLIQQISGYDILALANRDLSPAQKKKWDEMVGNVAEMYDPANAYGRIHAYPNCAYDASGAEPSIRARRVRVPIPIFWALNSQQAFPLVCLQYNELHVEITLRPVRELFQIRDVTLPPAFPVVAPNFNIPEHQFFRFLQTPPNPALMYPAAQTTSWNENMHLSCTYCFLSDEEARHFAVNQQQFLFKELHNSWFYKVAISDRAWLQNTAGMVSSWMFLFQRSDVSARNEWSNFTNWPYDFLPSDIRVLPITMENSPCQEGYEFDSVVIPEGQLGYGLNPSGKYTGFYGTGTQTDQNQRDILLRLGIALDGAVREEDRTADVFLEEQSYLHSPGTNSVPGIYYYNFCLNTDPFVLQPSGAMNLSKYSKVELPFTTITPPVNPDAIVDTFCDPETGNVLATNKALFNLYLYTFNFLVIEERYNVLVFSGGNAALMSAR
jgi:hypothetical protein